MKKYILILAILFLSIQMNAQKNEYRYFSLKLGYSQGFSGQPGFNANKYLNTPYGEMQLIPVGSYMGFFPGFSGSLYYHFDFTNDMAGFYTGIEYNNYGVSAKYETVNGVYSMVEQNRINAVGIPLGIKVGKKFYEDQRYFFLGTQINYNIGMKSVQKVSWTNTPSATKLSKDEFQTTSMGFFAGFNWMVLNVALVYYPGSFFNKDYIVPELNIKPYAEQNDNMFFVNVSFHVPLPLSRGWLGYKSYKLKRFFRKLHL